MQYRSRTTVEAKQWFPDNPIAGVEPATDEEAYTHGQISSSVRTKGADGKLYWVKPGDYIIYSPEGYPISIMSENYFTNLYEPIVEA